jgi:hypothetical protein
MPLGVRPTVAGLFVVALSGCRGKVGATTGRRAPLAPAGGRAAPVPRAATRDADMVRVGTGARTAAAAGREGPPARGSIVGLAMREMPLLPDRTVSTS